MDENVCRQQHGRTFGEHLGATRSARSRESEEEVEKEPREWGTTELFKGDNVGNYVAELP